MENSKSQKVKNTNKHILLMADEIQSGLGRSGGLTAGNVLYNKIKMKSP